MARKCFHGIRVFYMFHRVRLQPNAEDRLARSKMFRDGAPRSASANAIERRFLSPGLYGHDIGFLVPDFSGKKRRAQLFNGGCSKNDGDREASLKTLFYPGEDFSGLHRGAAQVEKVVLHPNRSAVQHLLPDPDKLSFQVCSCRNRFSQGGHFLVVRCKIKPRAKHF